MGSSTPTPPTQHMVKVELRDGAVRWLHVVGLDPLSAARTIPGVVQVLAAGPGRFNEAIRVR